MLQDVHAVAGLDTSYCVPRPHAEGCPFPTYPSATLVGSSTFRVPCYLPSRLTLQRSNTPCASSTFVRNLHLLALGPSFPLPKYCPTFGGLRIS